MPTISQIMHLSLLWTLALATSLHCSPATASSALVPASDSSTAASRLAVASLGSASLLSGAAAEFPAVSSCAALLLVLVSPLLEAAPVSSGPASCVCCVCCVARLVLTPVSASSPASSASLQPGCPAPAPAPAPAPELLATPVPDSAPRPGDSMSMPSLSLLASLAWAAAALLSTPVSRESSAKITTL